jgi:hypothetical protein
MNRDLRKYPQQIKLLLKDNIRMSQTYVNNTSQILVVTYYFIIVIKLTPNNMSSDYFHSLQK